MTATLAPENGREHAVPDGGGRVVVGVDDTPSGLAALRYAVDLARAQGMPLVAVRAWALGLPQHGGRRHHHHGHGPLVFAFQGTAPRQAAVKLTKHAFDVATAGVPSDIPVRIETPEGDPGPVLTGIATPGDLLVVGTESGHRLKRALHGSVSAYCERHSRGQVVIVGPGEVRRDARAGG